MFVLRYVIRVVLNVKNIRPWNTANNVLKNVENVLQNVTKWLDKIRLHLHLDLSI